MSSESDRTITVEVHYRIKHEKTQKETGAVQEIKVSIELSDSCAISTAESQFRISFADKFKGYTLISTKGELKL